MKPIPILSVLIILSVASFAFFARPSETEKSVTSAQKPVASDALAAPEIANYTSLVMEEIFDLPAGPRGLEYSSKAKSLDGKKVQVTGYMVRHAHADPQVFLFAPRRMVLFQAEFGTADDLPAYALHVITPGPEGKAARYIRDEIRLLGTLELGPRQEVDGRISHVRLILDHVTKPGDPQTIPVLASLAMQPERLINAARANPSAP